MRDPGFMNLTGAPEPLGDSGRIVWGIFVSTAGARERTRGCSPWVIRAESSRGFCLATVCACILVETEIVNQGAMRSQGGFLGIPVQPR